MIYLGTLGRMVGIKCPATQQVSSEERYTFETSLEGRRKAHIKPVGRRTWALQTSDATTPADTATLMQFAQGAWGPGPFQFVSADAPFTNLLMPDGSMTIEAQGMAGIRQGGPVNLGADGWAAQSLISDDPMTHIEIYGSQVYTPVIPGRMVTGSAWISASPASTAYLRLYWRDVNAAIVGTSVSRGVVSSEGMVRVAVTAMPPVGAASVQVVSLRADRLTRPAITWTDEMKPWALGEGCQKAVVSSGSRQLVLTGADRTYSNLAFTVLEVG